MNVFLFICLFFILFKIQHYEKLTFINVNLTELKFLFLFEPWQNAVSLNELRKYTSQLDMLIFDPILSQIVYLCITSLKLFTDDSNLEDFKVRMKRLVTSSCSLCRSTTLFITKQFGKRNK